MSKIQMEMVECFAIKSNCVYQTNTNLICILAIFKAITYR